MATVPPSADAVPPQAGESSPGEAPQRRLHIALNRRHRLCLIAAGFPLLAGIILYGWRGAVSVVFLVLCSALAATIWRRIGARGSAISMPQVLWFSALLGLILPPHLLNRARLPDSGLQHWMPWTLIPCAACLLVASLWLVGGRGIKRVHPILLTCLILTGLFPQVLTPHVILNRDVAGSGDLSSMSTVQGMSDEPWIARRDEHSETDALWYDTTAAQALAGYTRGRPGRGEWLSVDALVRGAMPPLEDLVIGGHPGGFGASSAIGVLVAGLFMLYRRVISLRVPLVAIGVAWLAFFILPIPAAFGADGPLWRPLAAPRAHQDLATIITFANYELMASPLLFIAFFLAPSSGICPRTPSARMRFAFLFGIAAAASQLYLSVSFGPYVALALVNLLTPSMDPQPSLA